MHVEKSNFIDHDKMFDRKVIKRQPNIAFILSITYENFTKL